MTELDQDASYRRPLFIAASIAALVMAALAAFGVDLHRCRFEAVTKSEHTVSGGDEHAARGRELRLWLDAGALDAALQESLLEELAPAGITLTSTATKGGSVTLRVDDASFYTPLYASARVTAVMGFETGSAPGSTSPSVEGDTRVELRGGCYGAVAPSTFRARVARQVAAPLVKALTATLNASAR